LREGVFPLQIARWLKKCIKFILAKFFFFTNGNSQTLFFSYPIKNSAHCAFDTIYPKKGVLLMFSPFDYYWGPWGD